MTTLTQSDLKDLRRKAEAAAGRRIYKFQGDPAATVLALLDHIAQLTAERDEARKELAAAQGTADDNYKRWCDAQGRMAQLESASPDLAWFWVIVDRHGLFHEAPSDELDALAWICNTLNRAEARIAALEAQLVGRDAALKPFASVGRIIDVVFGPALFAKDDQAFKNGYAWRENGEDKFLTWGDFRRAAGVLARSEQEGK